MNCVSGTNIRSQKNTAGSSATLTNCQWKLIDGVTGVHLVPIQYDVAGVIISG